MTDVSVVIPAFNVQEWIAETLATVFAQTHRKLEVIVVDDGSTDRTAEIAAEVLGASTFPCRVLTQNNRGPSAARNRGWYAAKGEWIQFLDADDLLHPQKIEFQLRRAKEQPNVAVIYSDWQQLILDQDAKWMLGGQLQCPSLGPRTLSALIMDSNVLALGSQIVRRESLEQVNGFEESHNLIEDVELHLKIAAAGGAFSKAESSVPLFYYRDRPQSLSKLSPRRFVEACIRNAQFAEDELRRTSGLQPEDVDALVDAYYFAARFFAEHDVDEFERLVIRMETLKPGFRPLQPKALRFASFLVGYRNAEKFSVRYRQTKNVAVSWTRAQASSN